MADRPTRDIELPIGKQKVVLYQWANGHDKMALSGEQDNSKRIVSMIQRLVVSIGDEKDASKNMEAVGEMHGKDFDFLVNAVSEVIVNSSMPAEKKTS